MSLERFLEISEIIKNSYDLDPGRFYRCPAGAKPSEIFKCHPCIEEPEHAVVAQMNIFGGVVTEPYAPIQSEVFKRCYSSFSPEQRFNLLTQVMHFGDAVWLSIIPYPEFLQSLYWKIMRDYMVHQFPDCQLCKSKQRLHVRHKTYENRGWEWTAPFDNLITLCADCHGKFHDKRR